MGNEFLANADAPMLRNLSGPGLKCMGELLMAVQVIGPAAKGIADESAPTGQG
jgi:hypothetical protein